ncbi:MAG: hypothetical protein ACK4F4_07800 [Hylemonella sp.]|jgi:methylmalonyl-CoA mutase cobalamin-binding subunit|uniref:hypothetical protein n=1 Tax=Hylemonella sp. TaxID=2066020 RepID=UPI00391967DB
MTALSKKIMRSLPTLTEVVQAQVPAAASSAAGGTALDEEALMQRVLQRLELTLDEQVRQVVAAVLDEQMKELAPRIRQRVDAAVRKAVTQAVAGELKLPPSLR